jgi:hypothetical protein
MATSLVFRCWSHNAANKLIKSKFEQLVLDAFAAFVFDWRQGVLDN